MQVGEKMKFTFVPEYKFDTFDQATAEFLSSIGVRGVLLDVDNTLEPYVIRRRANT